MQRSALNTLIQEQEAKRTNTRSTYDQGRKMWLVISYLFLPVYNYC
jgi:hypothetical protein